MYVEPSTSPLYSGVIRSDGGLLSPPISLSREPRRPVRLSQSIAFPPHDTFVSFDRSLVRHLGASSSLSSFLLPSFLPSVLSLVRSSLGLMEDDVEPSEPDTDEQLTAPTNHTDSHHDDEQPTADDPEDGDRQEAEAEAGEGEGEGETEMEVENSFTAALPTTSSSPAPRARSRSTSPTSPVQSSSPSSSSFLPLSAYSSLTSLIQLPQLLSFLRTFKVVLALPSFGTLDLLHALTVPTSAPFHLDLMWNLLYPLSPTPLPPLKKLRDMEELRQHTGQTPSGKYRTRSHHIDTPLHHSHCHRPYQ